jgi:hypothetical protein
MWGLNTEKLIKNIRDHKPNGPEEIISRSKPNINIIQIDVIILSVRGHVQIPIKGK